MLKIVRHLTEISCPTPKPCGVYLGEFVTLGSAERDLLKQLFTQAQAKNQELLIVNFSVSHGQKFRAPADLHIILKTHFPELHGFEFQPLHNFHSTALRHEIFRFSKTNDFATFQIAAPLASQLNLPSHRCQYEKLGAEIIQQNHKIGTNLSVGLVESANQELAYYFFLNSYVVSGNKLGTRIGFPTLNLPINRDCFYPKVGCYITVTVLEDRTQHFGLTCLIEKYPQQFYFETGLENFSQNVYGQSVRTYFLHFYRENYPVAHPAALKELLEKDVRILRKKPALQFKGCL